MEGHVPARTWALASVVLVIAAVLIGVLGDIRVGSGSDAGGKLATARVMADGSTCDPDVGWWAAEWDPEARLHQLYNTNVVGERYVQGTSPTYQCLVMPLQRAFGPWGPVAVSIGGALLAALAAGSIAGRLGATGRGRLLAFALVGIFGAVFHYAVDVWEHAPAAGLYCAGVAAVLGPVTPRRALLAGFLFGAAAVLRADSVLYLGVLAVVGLAIADVRRRWLASWPSILAGSAALAATVATSIGLERSLLSTSVQSTRSGNLVERSTTGSEIGERIETAAVTGFGVLPSDEVLALALGAVFVVLTLLHARRALFTEGRLSPVENAVGGIWLVRWLYAPGFVPGVLAAAPFSLAGVWTASRSASHRWIVGTALIAAPVVWALQWPGNLVAQWGGRYLLATGILLTAAACTARPWSSDDLRRAGPLLASAVGIGLLGASWHVERTNALGSLVETIEDVPADSVIVSTEVNLAREAGGTYGDVRWLAVSGGEEQQLAEQVIDGADPSAVTTVRREGADALHFDGYVVDDTVVVNDLGRTWVIDRLVRQAA